MTKILITGATGFIGSFLVKQVKSARCVVRNNNKHLFEDCFVINGIDAHTCWDGAFKGISSIIHLAGIAHSKDITKEQYLKVNCEGTIRLAREAIKSKVKRFVFVSSIGVNGSATYGESFKSTEVGARLSNYSYSKYQAEVALKQLAHESDMELVIIRPTLVYGAGAPGNFGLLTKLVKLSPFLPFALVRNQRDFISVQNLVDLLVICTRHKNASGKTFLASDCQSVTLKDFTDFIALGLGKKIIHIPIPLTLFRFAGKLTGRIEMVEQLIGGLQVDSSNTLHELGWKPPFTMQQAMASLNDSGV